MLVIALPSVSRVMSLPLMTRFMMFPPFIMFPGNKKCSKSPERSETLKQPPSDSCSPCARHFLTATNLNCHTHSTRKRRKMQQEIPRKCRKISAGMECLRIFRIEKRELLKKLSVLLRGLLGAEDAVAGVAQTGDDVAVLVQVVVQRSAVDVHVGMRS